MGCEAREGVRAQTRVGGKRLVLCEPGGEGTGAHAHAETLGDARGNALPRLPTVVETEALQDHLERKGFAFGDLWGEDAVTGVAVPELDCLPLLIPLAFPGDARTIAVDAALGVRTDEGLARMG